MSYTNGDGYENLDEIDDDILDIEDAHNDPLYLDDEEYEFDDEDGCSDPDCEICHPEDEEENDDSN